MPDVLLGEIVDFVGGQYDGDRNRSISTVAPLTAAGPEHLSFLNNKKHVTKLSQSKAGAILVPKIWRVTTSGGSGLIIRISQLLGF
jgi:UDP-3-O-[3-hydroxymyristoyl] glucosamine N-acyltransferase